MESFRDQIEDYAQTLTRYVREHDLPMEWFGSPDHLAVKAADSADFENLIDKFRPRALQISCIEMDGRRLASVVLGVRISVRSFGEVEWLEIMEPRPKKVGKDVVGLEHMEFYYPHFMRVVKKLNDWQGDERDRPVFSEECNPGHAWVNIVLNDQGQELKFNDRPLAKIVPEELADDRAYLL